MITKYNYRWITRAITSVLIPSYVLAVSTRSLALSIPSAAEVSEFIDVPSGSLHNQIHLGQFDHSEIQPVHRGAHLSNLSQFLKIPGNRRAQVNLRYLFDTIPSAQLGVQAGPSWSPSFYYFPCRFEGGTFVVGWHAGTEGRPCSNPGITVNLDQSDGQASLPQLLQTADLPGVLASPKQNLTTQIASASNPLMRYCTIAARGRGWWVRWGNFENPCQEALQACLETGSADGCIALGVGHWRAKDQNLLVTVGCADDRFYSARGNGIQVATTLISDLAQEAKAAQSRVCALNVYQPDDIIIAPATDETTLIQTQDLGSSLAVDALAGDLLIRSTHRPDGLTLAQGHQYLSAQNRIQPIDVSEVAQSTAVRNFLDPASWPPEAASELDDYQKALDNTDDPPGNSSDSGGSDSGGSDSGGSDDDELDLLSPLIRFLIALGLAGADNGDNAPPPKTRTARIELSSRQLDFGQVPVGQREIKRLTITNSGSAPLNLGPITLRSKVFTLGELCRNVSLVPGESCQLAVNFRPQRGQAYSIDLNIPSDAENNVRPVPLTGTGVFVVE